MSMKLKFDPDLDFQKDAIRSVVDLFEGSPSALGQFEVNFGREEGSYLDELGLGNNLIIDYARILENLQKVQVRNEIDKSSELVARNDTYSFPNFSIEMETGTGKTYVYLRTIFELNQKYGFKKFIIVVPSVAIREGVISSIKMMREHFRALFDNVPFDSFVYSSDSLNRVRQFAYGNEIQIMIINIQAFQKDENIFNKEREKNNSGRSPKEFVNATKPIVIIDEPQSVDNTEKSKEAINQLNPLFCLRYSATHTNSYNVIYKLDPVKAYDLQLVKKIEVSSVISEKNFNNVFISIDKIAYGKGAKIPHAKATIYEDSKTGPKEKKVTLQQGTDISHQTNRKGYDGYIVSNISAEPGNERVDFANGASIQLSDEIGGMTEEVLKAQIRETVQEHFEKELRYKSKGIKVLSLFFVDKVANYRFYDDDGVPQKGKFAEWFEEAFIQEQKRPCYKGLVPFSADQVHDGYFAADRKKGQVICLKDTSGKTKADDEVYKLIMCDKESLLSLDEPLRFIFSHSALREGWDNPNVFQICTLRELGTDRERRQTLGRGLRLPVICCGEQAGERVYDPFVNKLTVIASESFEDYARGLQQDIEKDIGPDFKFGRIKKIAFSGINKPGTESSLGQEISEQIWEALKKEGYIDSKGDVTDKFDPKEKGFKLNLPSQFKSIDADIIDEIERHLYKGRVVNKRDRRTLKFNKRIELNNDFKALWEKISRKTRFRVEFSTNDLIQLAVKKINKMEQIKPVRLFVDKSNTELNRSGVEKGSLLDSKTYDTRGHECLPDILAFLQRETELTRGTLVEVLKKCGRLQEFFVNSQSFMTEVAKLINRSLQELMVDGVKYEQLDGQHFQMRLFEMNEVETYLSKLYEVKSDDNRTLYDYIPYESEGEREIAEKLDTHKNVKFFCKLPSWFKVPTPLGAYCPDWAIVTSSDEKLYLIRETKSTYDRSKRRESENMKVDCGKAHFDTLGVNFKVATSLHDFLEK